MLIIDVLWLFRTFSSEDEVFVLLEHDHATLSIWFLTFKRQHNDLIFNLQLSKRNTYFSNTIFQDQEVGKIQVLLWLWQQLHKGESNENLKSVIKIQNTARLTVSWQQWYSWLEEWPTGGNGDYIEKWSHCVPFVSNKLRYKKYLRFSFDSPSYTANMVSFFQFHNFLLINLCH